MSKRFTLARPDRWLLAAVSLAVSLLPAWPADEGSARIISLAGQVSVLRDSGPWALTAGDVVQPQQVILTGPDGAAELKLADGSTFQVFPNSRVVFRNNPGNWK